MPNLQTITLNINKKENYVFFTSFYLVLKYFWGYEINLPLQVS